MLKPLIVALVIFNLSVFTAIAADLVTLISAFRYVTVNASASTSGMTATDSHSSAANHFRFGAGYRGEGNGEHTSD
jgi:hypothetical protein